MEIISDYPINTDVLKTIYEIFEDYNALASYSINENSDKIILTSKHLNTCRFCGKSKTAKEFKHEAHAIPHFTGNTKLFTKYECNSCNSYFAKFESEMANFMLLNHAMSGIEGKKGAPKYKQSGEPTIYSNLNQISISNLDNSLILRIKDENKELSFKIPTYIPDSIYRCLIKIAISIIPENHLEKYRRTINWLMDIDMESDLIPLSIISIYPTSYQLPEIRCVYLEKRSDCNKAYTNSIFYVAYGNFTFQTYLPYHNKTEIDVFPFIFPSTIDLNENYKNIRQSTVINLSSKKKKVGDEISFTITEEK